ncbi:hypothetical protein ACQ4PT_071548 [Festuca glaucescens]
MSSSWFRSSSSSSSHRFYEERSVHSYEPYFDDEDDVKPAVTEHWRRDHAYGGVRAAEDVKPAKQQRPGGGIPRVKDERRDYPYAYGGVGAMEDVKPARPGGGIPRVHDEPRDYPYAYGGVGAVEDVKPAKQQRPGGAIPRVHEERRDYPYPYGGVGAVEDVKPAKQKQPRPGGGAGGGSRPVHDDQTVLSWPMVEQFKSTLRTQEALAGLRTRYSIPEGFGLHLAGTNQAACAPPPPPVRGARGGGASAVPVCVHTQAFAAGMRLPLHPFVSDALAHFGIAPSQLAPNGWRTLVGFAVLCHFRGAGAPTLPVFRRFFALATLPNGKGWYNFRARESVPALFTGLPTSIKGWKEEFLLVSPPPGAPWRCPVKWGVATKEAMGDPVLTDSDAAVVRLLSQGQGVVDLKTYLSESNLVAAKISRAPACPGVAASQGAPSRAGKKTQVPAGGGGNGGDVLRSELQAKEKALSKAKGEISQLKKELGNAKKRELAKAQQELAYAAQVLVPEGGGKGAGANKRRRGAQ